MSDADIVNLLAIMQLLIAPIAISIGLIALGSYRRFRNWRLLFLSVAFFLLSVPSVIDILLYPGILPGLSSWTTSELYYVSIIFSIASVAPFALLAYVYMDERRRQSIEITRGQWAVGSLLVLAEVGFILYWLIFAYGESFLSSGFSTFTLFYFLYFILSSVGYILIILIVISLFSYYRAKKTRNTLVVMIGFICLLLSQGYGVFGYLVQAIPGQNYTLAGGLAVSIELAGYIAFLVALLRLKVFR